MSFSFFASLSFGAFALVSLIFDKHLNIPDFLRVKSALRLLALAIVFSSLGWWLSAGANRGWTKNKVPVKVVDEVTGIEGTTSYRKQFIPGVDFLAEGAGAAVLCVGLSFLFRTKPPAQTSNEKPGNS